MRGSPLAAAAFAVLLAAVSAGHAAAPSSEASEAIDATVAVERELLVADVRRYEELSARRAQIATTLDNLYATLDHVVSREDPLSPEELTRLADRVNEEEQARDRVLTEQRDLIRAAIDRSKRIRLLEERLGRIEERERATAGPLAGRWIVVMFPSEQRGMFELVQTGTLVSGTYELSGGFSGSLRGTLVDRKIFLERIDAKLGRTQELVGRLSMDGDEIQGRWESYDLGAEGGPEGRWSAEKVD